MKSLPLPALLGGTWMQDGQRFKLWDFIPSQKKKSALKF